MFSRLTILFVAFIFWFLQVCSYSQLKYKTNPSDRKTTAATSSVVTSGYDTARLVVHAGWNLLSLPVAVQNGRKSVLFPTARSEAFMYNGGYNKRDTLLPGVGYWLKFAALETIKIAGQYFTQDTVHLRSRWNMVGSLSTPVPISTIHSDPSDIIIPNYFGYQPGSGYYPATVLEPGKGYWVKASQVGTMKRFCWEDIDSILLAPANTSTTDSLVVTLRWHSSPCSNTYQIQAATDSIFNNLIVSDSTIADTSYQTIRLEYATEYFWHIGVRSPSGEIYWTRVWSFATPWEYLGFPNNMINAIIVVDTNTMYIAADGVFKTTNAGASWDTLLYGIGIMALNMHPTDSRILYAGIGASIYPPYGFMKTTDGGANWFFVNSGIYLDWETMARDIQFDPLYPETLYVSIGGYGHGDVYKTINGGTNWIDIMHGDDVSSIAVHPETTGIIYIGIIPVGYLLKTTNGGISWASTNVNGFSTVRSVRIDPSNYQTLYFIAEGRGNPGVYKSTDAGNSWIDASNGLPRQAYGARIVVSKYQERVFVSLTGDSGCVYESRDQGQNWGKMPGLAIGKFYRSPSLSPDEKFLYITFQNGGIYRKRLK
jgi:photosystem II stability/assembly factor-like uncharacterized protein